MTLPDEELKSLQTAREFLLSLLDAKQTPKVPMAIRQFAKDILKHYPQPYRVKAVWEPLIAKQEKLFSDSRERDALFAKVCEAVKDFPSKKGVIVGHDERQIVVYIEKGVKSPKIPEKWHGVPVSVLRMSPL